MAKTAIPNIFTFGNLVCGVLSIIMTYENNPLGASIFILLAGLMDRYDGRIARFLQVSSDLGKELDSLADLVSFGVAPSLLMFKLNNFVNLGIIGYILVLLFPISGAYRLARYNSSEFNNVFLGIPITIAGMFIALYSLVTINHNSNIMVSTILLVSLSYLMISKLKFKKV
ncbi:CDP-diacylglycerol--serine O-phosphatidyltransferase [Haloimpatiens sp. FM7315]|uniref:CDP-diacylglycerol--serine O-phosphatidyltransferase n=1 Tax=Haloimpatiens sp. FM7315 TaxID=3298609 RepID=UPI0035A29D02